MTKETINKKGKYAKVYIAFALAAAMLLATWSGGALRTFRRAYADQHSELADEMGLIGHPAGVGDVGPRQAALTLMDDSFDACQPREILGRHAKSGTESSAQVPGADIQPSSESAHVQRRVPAQQGCGAAGNRIHRRPQTTEQESHHRPDPLGAGRGVGEQLAAHARLVIAEQVRERDIGIGKIAKPRSDDPPRRIGSERHDDHSKRTGRPQNDGGVANLGRAFGRQQKWPLPELDRRTIGRHQQQWRGRRLMNRQRPGNLAVGDIPIPDCFDDIVKLLRPIATEVASGQSFAVRCAHVFSPLRRGSCMGRRSAWAAIMMRRAGDRSNPRRPSPPCTAGPAHSPASHRRLLVMPANSNDVTSMAAVTHSVTHRLGCGSKPLLAGAAAGTPAES